MNRLTRIITHVLLFRKYGPHLLAAGFGVGAIYPLIELLWVQVHYPGELEWMEGQALGHVVRVLEGLPLYSEPSVEFTAYIYPPMHAWVGALVSLVLGASLKTLHLISAIATCGSMLVIVDWVRRRHNDWLSGLAGAGIFAATFHLSGAWFATARVDSLFVFFVLLAGHLLLNFRGTPSAIVGAFVLAGAVLTKQSGMSSLCLLAMLAACSCTKRGVLAAVLSVLTIVVSVAVLHWSTSGWFWYYTVELPRSHEILSDWIKDFWVIDVWTLLAAPAIMSLFAGLATLSQRPEGSPPIHQAGFKAAFGQVYRADLLIMLLSLLLPAWAARFHSGMYENVLMPMHAALALGTAEALAHTRTLGRDPRPGSAQSGFHMSLVWSGAVIFSLLGLQENYISQTPDARRSQAFSQAVDELKQLPPNTWVVTNQGLGHSAGLPIRSHAMALFDIFRANQETDLTKQLVADVRKSLREKRFGAVVIPGKNGVTGWFWRDLERGYKLEKSIEGPNMTTGWDVHLVEIWRPRAGPTHREGSQ